MSARAKDLEAENAELKKELEHFKEECELLKDIDEQYEALKSEHEALKKKGKKGGTGNVDDLQDEIAALQKKLKKEEDKLVREQQDHRNLDDKLRDLQAKYDDTKSNEQRLKDEKIRLQDQLEDSKSKLHAEQERGKSSLVEEDNLNKTRRSHTKQLADALQEVHAFMELSEQKSAEIEVLKEAINDLNGHIKERDSQISSLAAERNDTEVSAAEIKRNHERSEKEIDRLTKTIDDLDNQLEEKDKDKKKSENKLKAEIEELKGLLKKEKEENAHLNESIQRLNDTTNVAKLEKQIATIQTSELEYKQEIADLNSHIDQLEEDNDTMRDHLQGLTNDMDRKVDAAVTMEKKQVADLRAQLTSAKAEVQLQLDRYNELLAEKAEVDAELEDERIQMQRYEKGHNLEELMAYQRKLKADIKLRDKDIEKGNENLSNALENQDALQVTNMRLKKMCNLAEDFKFDDVEIHEEVLGQIGRQKAINRELLDQNDSLEKERLRLLTKLKRNAANLTEHGIKFYKLDEDQMTAVIEFAAKLREGEMEIPMDDRSYELNLELKKVKKLNDDLKLEIALLKVDTEKTSRGGGGGGQSASEAKALKELQAEVSLLRETSNENARMRNQLQELPGVIRQQLLEEMASAAPIQSPKDKRVMQMMEKMQEQMMTMTSGKSSKEEIHGYAAQQQELTNMLKGQLDESRALNEKLTKDLSDVRLLMAMNKNDNNNKMKLQVEIPNDSKPNLRYPSSPEGKKLNARIVKSLELPEESWAEDMASIHAQLVECLEELTKKQDLIKKLGDDISVYERDMELMCDQTSLLYAEYADSNERWSKERKNLTTELENAKQETEIYKTKNATIEAALEALKGTESDVREHLKDNTKRLVTSEVDQIILSRKFNLLVAEENISRSSKEALEKDIEIMDASLKYRVLYLEQWKKVALERFHYLEQNLTSWVPQTEMDLCRKELEAVKSKYQNLLVVEADLRVQFAETKDLPVLCSSLKAECKRLKVEKMETEEISKMYSIDLAELHKKIDEATHLIKTDKNVSLENRTLALLDPSLIQIAKYRGDATRLDIELAGARKKIEILEVMTAELKAKTDSTVKRYQGLDESFVQMRNSYNEVTQKLQEMVTKYEGGATRDIKEIYENRINDLEKTCEALDREVEKQKEIAEIASNQAAALSANIKNKEELSTAQKEHLAKLETRSDDDTIIGKLHRQLVTMKISYQQFARKFESSRINLKRKELENRQLQKGVDDKNFLLVKLQEEARVRILTLQSALNQVNDKCGTGITLAQAESLSESIKHLAATSEKSTNEMKLLQNRVDELEEDRILRQSELDSLRQEASDLRRVGDKDSTSGFDQLRSRLLDLNERLKTSTLVQLRTQRELQVLRAENKHLTEQAARSESNIKTLEDGVATTEALLRSEKMKWLGVGTENDKKGSPPEASKPDYLGVFASDFANINPSSVSLINETKAAASEARADIDAVVLSAKYEEGLKKQENASKELTAQMNLVADLQAQIRIQTLKVSDLEGVISDKDSVIRMLKQQINLGDTKDANGDSLDNSHGGGGFKLDDGVAKRLQDAASQTIQSLKEVIERKNKTVNLLKKKLEAFRAEREVERSADQKKIEQLTEQLYDDNRDAIGKLREAVGDLDELNTGMPNNHHDALNSALLQRATEAEEEALLNERKVKEIEFEMIDLNRKLSSAENRMKEAMDHAEDLEEDLAELKKQLQDKSTDHMVQQLRLGLKAKDKKMEELKMAISKLKDDFEAQELKILENATRNNSRSKRGNDDSLNEEVKKNDDDEGSEDLRKTVSQLKDTVSLLQQRITRTRNEIEEVKAREIRANEIRSTLQKEIDLLSTQVKDGEMDTKKHSDLANRLRSENSDLKEKVNSLTSQIDLMKSSNYVPKSNSNDNSVLIKRVKLLEAQNAALRGAANVANSESKTKEKSPHKKFNDNDDENLDNAPSPAQESKSNINPRSQWENDKKLKKRVEALSSRLAERTTELEVAVNRSEQAKDLLAKAQSRIATLENQIIALEKQTKGFKAAATGELQSVIPLREKVYELEEEIRRLTRIVNVQMPADRNRYDSERKLLERRAGDAEARAESVLRRIKEAEGGGDNIDKKLRSSENRFVVIEEMRDQMESSQKKVAELESALLDRDNIIVELRFDNEANKLDASRMRKRVEELKAVNSMLGADENDDSSLARKPGERFKRERDLENVVDALKRVVDKQKREIERLQKQGVSNTKYVEITNELRDFRRKCSDLNAENEALRNKIRNTEIESSNANRGRELIMSLKTQLKDKESEVKIMKQKLDSLTTKNENLENEVIQANSKLTKGSKPTNNVTSNNNNNSSSPLKNNNNNNDNNNNWKNEKLILEGIIKDKDNLINELKRTSNSSEQTVIRDLREKLSDTRAQLDKERKGGGGGGSKDGGGKDTEVLVKKLSLLERENANLKKELAAFDIDFFEEIEELKYQYSLSKKRESELLDELDRRR